MVSFRVNADYESELFFGKAGPPVLNQSLEFLVLFLEETPLFTQKVYQSDYMSYVESLTGRRPKITSQGPYENWWGALKNIEVERWFNSKLTSAQLNINNKWCSDTRIINSQLELEQLDQNKVFLLKDPFGMSGQKIQMNRSGIKVTFPVIAEPFLSRKYDFGTYIWPDGKIIHYQNIVDEKFQYKGTLFSNWQEPSLVNLPFYHKIAKNEWLNFAHQLSSIVDYYNKYPNYMGYSVDSFVYEERGELKIRSICEVNYRRTMGRVTYELAQKFAGEKKTFFLELRPQGTAVAPDKVRLSPGDTRFEIMFSSY